MLELVVQDDEFNPERTVTNVQFLIEQEDVFAIWGNVGSAPSSAALPVITGAGRPSRSRTRSAATSPSRSTPSRSP